MTDLRKISARLIHSVSDKVSQDLGYRYLSIKIGSLNLNPRPKITDISTSPFSEATYASWVSILGGLPNRVYEIRIPKVLADGTDVTEESLNLKSSWELTTEDGDKVKLRPLDIESTNSAYIVRAAQLKGKI